MKQTCILILGMHRSGTSALTGLLNLLDVYIGTDLMHPNEANTKGYFESYGLYFINDSLLSTMKSSWDDVFYDPSKLELLSQSDVHELKEFIRNEFKYSKLFAIKDPRLAYLFPIYEQVLEELGIDIKIVIPYRNPIEVANSLKNRDFFSLEKGLLLWAYHLLLTEKHSRNHSRIFIDFNDLIADTEATLQLISERLNLELMPKFRQNHEEVNAFLEPGMKHHNISLDNFSQSIPSVITSMLQLRHEFNNASIKSQFDHLYRELVNYRDLFYHEEIRNNIDALQEATEKIGEMQNSLEGLQESLHNKTEEFNQEQSDRTRFENALHIKTQELVEVQSAQTRLEDALHVKTRELAEEQSARTQLENALHVKTRELAEEQSARTQLENALHVKTRELAEEQSVRTRFENALHVKTRELAEEQSVRTRLAESYAANEKQHLQKLENHQATIQNLQNRLENLQQELLLIYTGKSWKITKPLRMLKRFFK